MALHNHHKFLQVLTRLRDTAKTRGDHAFAEALGHCLGLASGDPQCPVGQALITDRYSDGLAPEFAASPRSPAPVSCHVAKASDKTFFENAVRMMRKEAQLKHDEAFAEALRRCEESFKKDDFCPMHHFFQTLDESHPAPPIKPSRKI